MQSHFRRVLGLSFLNLTYISFCCIRFVLYSAWEALMLKSHSKGSVLFNTSYKAHWEVLIFLSCSFFTLRIMSKSMCNQTVILIKKVSCYIVYRFLIYHIQQARKPVFYYSVYQKFKGFSLSLKTLKKLI